MTLTLCIDAKASKGISKHVQVQQLWQQNMAGESGVEVEFGRHCHKRVAGWLSAFVSNTTFYERGTSLSSAFAEGD